MNINQKLSSCWLDINTFHRYWLFYIAYNNRHRQEPIRNMLIYHYHSFNAIKMKAIYRYWSRSCSCWVQVLFHPWFSLYLQKQLKGYFYWLHYKNTIFSICLHLGNARWAWHGWSDIKGVFYMENRRFGDFAKVGTAEWKLGRAVEWSSEIVRAGFQSQSASAYLDIENYWHTCNTSSARFKTALWGIVKIGGERPQTADLTGSLIFSLIKLHSEVITNLLDGLSFITCQHARALISVQLRKPVSNILGLLC